MGKLWIEIKATGPLDWKDKAVEILINRGSPSVLEEYVYGASEGRARLKAYLCDADSGPILKDLKKDLRAIGWGLSTGLYRDIDWSFKWRAGIKTVRLCIGGKTLVIKPTWRRIRKSPGAKIIEIDPGMAFGTGGHATTRTCLKALFSIIHGRGSGPFKKGMLDLGTGSGILAIAAKKLGIKEVVAIDIDPVALKVARKNAALNNASIKFSVKWPGRLRREFSIAVANIVSPELIRLSVPLSGVVAENGYLILSGILRHELKDVVAAYGQGRCLKLLKVHFSGEWATPVFIKQPTKEAR
ncbi:MAG: 50S ribosomal protein L11 methyltransferase [Deltaproteobacteria bacterium]